MSKILSKKHILKNNQGRYGPPNFLLLKVYIIRTVSGACALLLSFFDFMVHSQPILVLFIYISRDPAWSAFLRHLGVNALRQKQTLSRT